MSSVATHPRPWRLGVDESFSLSHMIIGHGIVLSSRRRVLGGPARIGIIDTLKQYITSVVHFSSSFGKMSVSEYWEKKSQLYCPDAKS